MDQIPSIETDSKWKTAEYLIRSLGENETKYLINFCGQKYRFRLSVWLNHNTQHLKLENYIAFYVIQIEI